MTYPDHARGRGIADTSVKSPDSWLTARVQCRLRVVTLSVAFIVAAAHFKARWLSLCYHAFSDGARQAVMTGFTEGQQKIYFSIWAKTVDTQMHFNEMSVKSRQFGLAFVAASLGLGILLLSRGQEFAISFGVFGGFQLHATVLVVLSGAFALYAVSILDLNVYHNMLRGAVSFGEDFEQTYMKQIFGLDKGMTQAISHFSRYEDAIVTTNSDGKYEYRGTKRKNALEKIRTFYRVSIWILVATAALLFVVTAHFGQAQ